MADIVSSLFGVTPEMYQQAQAQQADQQALQYAQLSPFQQANFAIGSGAYRLAGALGGEDPQLKMISTRNAIARQMDLNDPQSINQAMQALSQAGDTVGAMQLMAVADQAQKRRDEAQGRIDAAQARALAQEDLAVKRQQQRAAALAQQIALSAYQPGGQPAFYGKESTAPMVDDEGNVMPGAGVTKPSFNLESVAPALMALGPTGISQLEALTKAQELVQPKPKYEKAGDVWYKIEPGQAPVPIGGVFKKGEKLANRDPQGNWSYITPGAAAATPVNPAENPINALIQGNAIHASVLPYAKQIARGFETLDAEDQDRLMEKLTRLNNSAVDSEANKGFRAASAATSAATAELTREFTRLRIDAARKAQVDAADGKPLPSPTLEKLSKQSDGVVKQEDLFSSFRDNFVGYRLDTLGKADIALALRSDKPERQALGSWWQSYQDHVNRVRNDLFGAALTSTEKAEFDRAMVTPGMSPQAARTNLERQAIAARAAYDKITKALIANGSSKSAIEALSPGIPMTAAPATAAPVAPSATPTAAPAPTALPGGARVRRVQ